MDFMDATPVIAGRRIVESAALPLCVFSFSLTVLLTFSWAVILPQFTQFDVDGRSLTASALLEHRDDVELKIDVAQARRDELLLSSHDESYLALKGKRESTIDPDVIRRDVAAIARADAGPEGRILLTEIGIDMEQGNVHVKGEARGGPGSMTTLASFVERLRNASIVASLIPPVFERRQTAKGDFFSPFSFAFALRSSEDAL